MDDQVRLKEELAWLKLLYTTVFAADVALIGWTAQSYIHAVSALTYMATAGVMGLTLFLAGILFAAQLRIRRLKE